jgi:hydroxyethylthiazole kinase-like uncharacterized protein yjeF
VAEPIPLDSTWLREHPLPPPDPHGDKNARGRVFAVGGCAGVPGGLLLTAEAALRTGAGKVQAASVASSTLALGIAMPEIGVIPLDDDEEGEIGGDLSPVEEAFRRCDAAIVGPAMYSAATAGRIVDTLLAAKDCEAALVLDCAALMSLGRRASQLARRAPATILTPHMGEMAAMLECETEDIEADRFGAVRRAADRFAAVVVLKGSTSLIADPSGTMFAYAGGGVGLATGGSGDVLAGMAAGLAARGAEPLSAALWAVWLHGEAGRRCAEQIGPLGFLARELLAHVPGLMRAI